MFSLLDRIRTRSASYARAEEPRRSRVRIRWPEPRDSRSAAEMHTTGHSSSSDMSFIVSVTIVTREVSSPT